MIALLATACSTQDELAPGRLDVALVGVGGSGATYRLPPGTSLVVSNASYQDSFSLDADTPMVSINVPAGDYFATLYNSAGYGTVWPLSRERPGGVSDIVDATLRTAMPAMLTVPDGFSVNLVLVFDVADGGSIVFSQGTIDVTLDVGESVSTDGTLVYGAGDLLVSNVAVYASAPAALASRVPALGDNGLTIAISGGVPGSGWYAQTSYRACSAAALSASASGSPGLEAILAESSGGQALLCVDTAGHLTVFLDRFGAPATTSYSDLGSAMQFSTVINMDLPAPAFDGTTVSLAAIAGTRTGATAVVQNVSDYSTGTGQAWASLFYEGTATVQFTPTAP